MVDSSTHPSAFESLRNIISSLGLRKTVLKELNLSNLKELVQITGRENVKTDCLSLCRL